MTALAFIIHPDRWGWPEWLFVGALVGGSIVAELVLGDRPRPAGGHTPPAHTRAPIRPQSGPNPEGASDDGP